jgi:hypothetical protein
MCQVKLEASQRRMRDLSSPSWVIPRFLGKRVIRVTLTDFLALLNIS